MFACLLCTCNFKFSELWLQILQYRTPSRKAKLSRHWQTVPHRRTSQSHFVTPGCFIFSLRMMPPSSDVLVGLPCVYLWITVRASKYSLCVAVVCLLRFLRSGNFQLKSKRSIDCTDGKFNSQNEVWMWFWRQGTELRHFDQDIWRGNNCDMVVFTADESRVEVVGGGFTPSVCLHCAFYSKQSLTELPSLFEMHVIQDSIKPEFWSIFN